MQRQKRRVSVGFRQVRSRFYRRFWEEAASGIGARLDAVDGNLLRIRKGNHWTLVRKSDVMLDSQLAVRVAGDKRLVTHLLQEAGFRAPRHVSYSMASMDKAARFMEQLGGRVVVKPESGTGAGQGVTTGISKGLDLRQASLHAAVYFSSRLLVEEEVAGSSFRLLYIGGRYVDAVRRDPPAVVGNGKHTVRELMAMATQRRLEVEDAISLHPLGEDLDCKLRLREEGFSFSTRPPAGRRLVVKRVVNQNASQENHIVREQVHPSIVERGAELVSLFGLELTGVDLMCSDITRPISDSDVYFNEINAMPGLHHHVLVADQSERLPLGEMLLEHLFATTSRRIATTAPSA